MEQTFSVKTEHFEGPLDLLLTLIEKRKLHVSDVSLARVADDYIAYVEKLEEFPMSETANFILIASTLLLIKSKSLLPNLSLTSEEQESVDDLERRLKQLKRFRDLSLHIKNMFGVRVLYEKTPRRRVDPVFSPDELMTLGNLLNSIRQVIQSLPKTESVPQTIVKKVLSLEDVIEKLTERIKGSLKMSFSSFSNIGKEEKVNVIVGFLAMLELVKQGIINVRQENKFDEIEMENQVVSLPRY